VSKEWPFYILIALAALPAALGIFAALAFNAKTYVFVRNIQRAHARQEAPRGLSGLIERDRSHS
jgi:hypothetical protein